MQIQTVLGRLSESEQGALTGDLVLTRAAPQHVGLGSKTTLLLTALRAACAANSLTASRDSLASLSGRGGASGVGVHGYFLGGLICDAGRRDGPATAQPSSAQQPRSLPALIGNFLFPPEWVIALIRDAGEVGLSAEAERQFFLTYRASVAETHSSIAATYHGVLPGVLQADLELLRQGLDAHRRTGFKAAEVARQSTKTQEMLGALLADCAVAAGLSSTGPLVYAIVHRDDSRQRSVVEELAHLHGRTVVWTRASNSKLT